MNKVKKRILILKGENKLDSLLLTVEAQRQANKTMPSILSRVKFMFSDGSDSINVTDYQLVVLLSNPNEEIWDIILNAEEKGIPTINNSNLIYKYNDCLQTQLDLASWGFNIPKLGVKGIKKQRFHEKRKNGENKSFHLSEDDFSKELSYYHEEYIEGELFKVKILGMTESFIIKMQKNGSNTYQRFDESTKYRWLGDLGLKLASNVGAEIISADFIVEKETGLPYCIDVNLGHAFTGVKNGTIHLLSYLAGKTLNKSEFIHDRVSVQSKA